MSITPPAKLDLARTPTPFYCLERLSEHLDGPRIWIKRDDLTECVASGNKIRKLEFTLAAALAAGCDTIVTSGGLQSNHCRATAMLCARLGLTAHLLLRDEGGYSESPEGNLLLDYLAGAQVSIVPKKEYLARQGEHIAAIVEDYRAAGKMPWVIPVGASDGHGVWGYINCAKELQQDFARAGIAPGKLFHATGSGGTQAGLSAGKVIYRLPCDVIGVAVCDDEQYFLDKVRADLDHWAELYQSGVDIAQIPVSVNDAYIGPGYAVAGEEVFEVIRLVARTEGIVLDPVYTAKGFLGMLEEIRGGNLQGIEDVVFVHTGGVYGLLAQGEKLGFTRPER